MTDQIEYVTKEKFEELEKELEHLKKIKRREVADNLEYAKSMGDLSENAEYQEAREQQAEVEERISKIEQIIKNAEILSAHHGGIITIGSTVVVVKVSDDQKSTYKIVGSEEADISIGLISNNSPLGSSLIGKKKGDSFEVNTPSGKIAYKIFEVK